MKISYQLSEDDYLAYQLYHSTRSKFIKYRLMRGWFLLTIGSLLLAAYFIFYNYNIHAATYFSILAIAAGFFYKKLFFWRYKRKFLKFIKESYSHRYGETDSLEFQRSQIVARDSQGEAKFKASNIEAVIETANHIFIKTSNNVSIIIPKKQVEDIDSIKRELKNLGLKITDELAWKWK